MKKLYLLLLLPFFLKVQAMHFNISKNTLSITNQEQQTIKNWFVNKGITWNHQDPKVHLLKTDQYIMVTTSKDHTSKFLDLSESPQRKIMIGNGVILIGKFESATKEFQDITEDFITSVY